MKRKAFFCLAILFAMCDLVLAQNFPIGIWFGGNQNAIDSVHAMGFTWIQAYGGWDRNNFSTMILQNTRNLNVAAVLERNIHNPSFAQRMEYQAERTDSENGTRNYFASPTTGQAVGAVRQALVNNHAAGWLAKDPIPNNEYHFERMHWVATANISIDLMGVPSDTVVIIEIANGSTILAQRAVRRSEFSSTAFDTFEVGYTLPPPSPAPAFFKKPVTATLSVQNDPAIDVRVYWHHKVNTYLDWVALQDSVVHPNLSGAYQLFRGQRDADITNDASFFASQTTYPLLQRFYLKDEPIKNGYQPFNYVDQRILNTANIQGSATGRGRGISATPNMYSDATSFARFTNEANPYEMMVDAYPITAAVPAPTQYIPASDAANAGIDPFISTTDYNTKLQSRFDDMLSRSFLPTIQAAQGEGVPWWYIAQVHGELDSVGGKYRRCDNNAAMLRPPSPEEIRCMVNLALAYGAKGVFYFWFPTGSDKNFGGCSRVRFPGLVAMNSENSTPNHSSNYDTFNGRSVFTGYQKKYAEVKAINAILATLGPILVNRTWQTAFTSGETAPGGSIVTSINVGTSGYIEAATFDSDYIMLVNRKCHPNDVQTIEITTNKSGQWLMDDQLTHELFVD